MMQRKIVCFTISYMIGIFLAHELGVPSINMAVILPVSLCATLIIGLLLYFKKTISYFLLICFCLGGIIYCSYKENIESEVYFEPGETYSITGMLTRYPEMTDNSNKMIVQVLTVNNHEVDGKVLINLLADKEFKVEYGDIVMAVGKVMPSINLRNPNQFDYEAYLRKKGIVATVSSYGDGSSIVLTGENRGNPFFKLAFGLRQVTEENLSHIPLRQAGFISGILFGDKSALDQNVKAALSQSGVMHAFAVSGLHMGYIALLVTTISSGLKLGRWSKFLLMFIVLILYGAMTGYQPSVVRAISMILIYMFIENTAQGKDKFTTLAISALILLLYNPLNLFDLGFLLSFAAVLGITYFSPVLSQVIKGNFPLKDSFIIMLAAQMGVTPLIIYYFNMISVITFLISPLVCILVGGIVILGFFSIILSVFYQSLGIIPLYLGGLLSDAVWAVISIGTQYNWSFFHIATPSALALFSTYALLFAFPHFDAITKNSGRSLMVILLIFGIMFVPFGNPHNELEVTFISVGQGDSIYIRSPEGKNIMIDGGGKRGDNGIGYYVLSPFLRAKGINKLDLVINTHPHDDHVNGLFPLIEQFEVDKIAIAKTNIKSSMFLLEESQNCKIPVRFLSSGDVIEIDDKTSIKVLHPDPYEDSTLNNSSLVLHLKYGDTSYLLTGDIEKAAIGELMSENENLSANVLKLPHHGAYNSFQVDFYQKINPDAVVVSLGKNTYGHPDNEILKYWYMRDVPVLRTDKDGAISFFSDGKKIRIKTYGEESIVE